MLPSLGVFSLAGSFRYFFLLLGFRRALCCLGLFCVALFSVRIFFSFFRSLVRFLVPTSVGVEIRVYGRPFSYSSQTTSLYVMQLRPVQMEPMACAVLMALAPLIED